MKTIYADEIFLLNLVINYFILLATARLCALPLKRPRFWVAAALGGLYSVFAVFPFLGFLAAPLMKLCLGIAMAIIAFGGERRLLRAFLAFLCVSAAFGGAVFAASLLAGAGPDGGTYISISFKVLIFSFALCYAVLTLIFKRLGRRAQRQVLEVSIRLGEARAGFRALKDTGNELYEPVSGLPVMVISPSTARKLLPDPLAAIVNEGALELLNAAAGDSSLKTRFRLIPYSAAGTRGGIMAVFRPDELRISGKVHTDILIGLSQTELCPDGEFSAVL